MIKQNKEVLLYLIFGVLTTIINIVTYKIFKNLLNIDYMLSTIIAWCFAVIFAYVTNRIYVFNSKNNNKTDIVKEIMLFISVRLSSLVIDIAIMYIGVTILTINDMLIKVFANVVIIIINYIVSKKIVFKNKT